MRLAQAVMLYGGGVLSGAGLATEKRLPECKAGFAKVLVKQRTWWLSRAVS